jgi:hypothetical protein
MKTTPWLIAAFGFVTLRAVLTAWLAASQLSATGVLSPMRSAPTFDELLFLAALAAAGAGWTAWKARK